MSTINIFIDESGDLGILGEELRNKSVALHDNFYLVSCIFHDSSQFDLNEQLTYLNQACYKFEKSGMNFMHPSLLLRHDTDLMKQFSADDTRKLFLAFANFIKFSDIKIAVFMLDKRSVSSRDEFEKYFVDNFLNLFYRNSEYFSRYNEIKIFYDKGQRFINNIIKKSANVCFKNVIDKGKVYQKDYRLLQACDFICTSELVNFKKQHKVSSKSESIVFNNNKFFKDRIIKVINSKKLK